MIDTVHGYSAGGIAVFEVLADDSGIRQRDLVISLLMPQDSYVTGIPVACTTALWCQERSWRQAKYNGNLVERVRIVW